MSLPEETTVVRDEDAQFGLLVRQKTPGSFDAWVGATGGELLRYARVVSSHDADAADLVQDALVAVFTRWTKFEDSDHAVAYARRVILNARISLWRRWTRRVVFVDVELLEEAACDPALRNAEVLVAHQLLGSLPASQRAAVYLRFYDDLTYRQIGDIIGCREATARSHVHRALHQLKQQLQKGSDDA